MRIKVRIITIYNAVFEESVVMIKKIKALAFTMIIALMIIPTASSAQSISDYGGLENRDVASTDILNERTSEIVAIEGQLFEYSHMQVFGSSTIQIKDIQTGHTDLVYSINDAIFLNGDVIGTIQDESDRFI